MESTQLRSARPARQRAALRRSNVRRLRLGAAVSLAAAALLQGIAGAAQPHGSRLAGPWDMIAFEVKSWGYPVTSWRLLADGSGSWTEAVRDADAPLGEYSLVWHEFAEGEVGYRQIEEVLSRLPDPAPGYEDCANLITDLPYGTIRLTRGPTTTEIEWNSGCMDDAYRTFMETLKAADTRVAAWGRAGRILRTEKPSAGAITE